MSYFRLTPASQKLLPTHIRLSGTFCHALQNASGSVRVSVTVNIEQFNNALELLLTFAGQRHTTSVVLDKRRKDTAERAARFIENAANREQYAGTMEHGEPELVSDIERTLRRAIRTGCGAWQLQADELEPMLTINRTARGYSARIDLNGAQCYLTLPADVERAQAMLADNLNRFLQGYRSALAAA